jgi:DNA topoisomerase-2
MAKKIEEKYQELSEIQHILNRPGMWVGSTKSEEKDSFIYNTKTGKFEMRITNYIPAMLKVVDEVISNSCDEFRRKDNMGLTELYVKIDKNTGEKDYSQIAILYLL